MKRKTILLDLGKLKDLHCGLGQVSLNYAKEWAKVSKPDLDVRFFMPKQFQGDFIGLNKVSQYPINGLGRICPFLNPKVDLWHSIHQDSRFSPPNKQLKYLLTIHDLNFIEEKSSAKSQKRLRSLQKKVDRADALSFISHFAKTEAEKYLNLGNKPCRVIYNGVEDPQSYKAQKPAWMKEDTPFVFSLGVFMAKKNFHVLIPMMKLIPDLHLVIAGNDKGAYANQIRQEIKELNLEDRIHIPGIVSNEEKNWLFKNMEAFVFPSKCEGFGLPVIEAMHLGKPVVLSTYTSLPEIGGKYAAYWADFNPENMAKQLKESIHAHSELRAQEIQAYANRFTWDSNRKAYQSYYQEILAEIK